MFTKEVYTQRRSELKKLVKSGVILFPGDHEIPVHGKSSTQLFRQDDTFLYYAGLMTPDLFLLVDVDENSDTLYGDDPTVADQVWSGTMPTVKELGERCGLSHADNLEALKNKISKAMKEGRKIHFLPQYRDRNLLKLEALTGIPHHQIDNHASRELIQAVVKQRSIKSDIEVQEIEKALDVTAAMHRLLREKIKPGIYERELVGELEAIVTKNGGKMSYTPILTVHGQYLHNTSYDNLLKAGEIVLADVGSTSREFYSSDITRVYPVSGKFSDRQKEIYEIVLSAQLQVIDAIKPGVTYRDMHIKAALLMAEGLKKIGLMQGNLEEAVHQGAHALFFPHGLGHMIGLANHDMEGWAKDCVGYDDKVERSTQFGMAYLRLGRKLEAGFVFSVEPGIYFIPELIHLWKSENKFKEFICYEKLDAYMGIGIRIEDDIYVTEEGCRVLGKPIPKKVSEIEK